jgi:hypothetical protein
MNQFDLEPWSADWAWGIPLIVITVIFHVLGLGLVENAVELGLKPFRKMAARMPMFVTVLGATVLSTTLLHAAEAAIWAKAYLYLGALTEVRSAMLYSLSAMTSFGHANLFLANQWQMMGALESLNGMLLFGLTTAFLYGIIRKIGAGLERRSNLIVKS